jgi:hypothetical protein
MSASKQNACDSPDLAVCEDNGLCEDNSLAECEVAGEEGKGCNMRSSLQGGARSVWNIRGERGWLLTWTDGLKALKIPPKGKAEN